MIGIIWKDQWILTAKNLHIVQDKFDQNVLITAIIVGFLY